jgi:chemotaxis protein histidine kinase CheA
MQDDDDTIKILKDMFKQKLPDKMAKINSEWQAIEKKWDDKEQLALLFKSIHMLRGSAGSYGFPEISESIKELEIYLNELMKQNNSMSTDQKTKIEMMLQKLQETVANVLAN